MNPVNQETLEVIAESAAVCRNAAKATLDAEIGFDEKSILAIDDLVAKGWPEGEAKDQIIQVWGCFLGEAMRHTLKGQWVQTEAGLGIAVGNAVAHPITKVEKRFRFGNQESVSHFYLAFKGQLPPPKKGWWPF